MGITRQAARLLFQAHAERALSGEYLSVGKQTVNVTRDDLAALGARFVGEGFRVPDATDQTTRHRHGSVPDHALLGAISGSLHYNCLDRSAYEGANIIADMNHPVPADLKGRFDFVHDGSCIDNLFDPATFIRNLSELLRPGGRCLITVHGSLYPGAFLMFSPEWFFSYFAVNGYRSCRVFLTETRTTDNDWCTARADWFGYSPYFTRDPDYDRFQASRTDSIHMLYVLAEKGVESTSDKTPTQLQYADADHVRMIQRRYDEWAGQFRPLELDRRSPAPPLPLRSDHFTYLGTF